MTRNAGLPPVGRAGDRPDRERPPEPRRGASARRTASRPGAGLGAARRRRPRRGDQPPVLPARARRPGRRQPRAARHGDRHREVTGTARRPRRGFDLRGEGTAATVLSSERRAAAQLRPPAAIRPQALAAEQRAGDRRRGPGPDRLGHHPLRRARARREGLGHRAAGARQPAARRPLRPGRGLGRVDASARGSLAAPQLGGRSRSAGEPVDPRDQPAPARG